MKTIIQCPHCQSNNVKSVNKKAQALFGVAVALIGIGFLIVATTTAVGYYLFAFPLCTLGGIRAYKGFYTPNADAHCHDCKSEFEYVMDLKPTAHS